MYRANITPPLARGEAVVAATPHDAKRRRTPIGHTLKTALLIGAE